MEKRGRQGGGTHPPSLGVHMSRPDCILVLSSRPLVLIIVTFLNIVPYMCRYSLKYRRLR